MKRQKGTILTVVVLLAVLLAGTTSTGAQSGAPTVVSYQGQVTVGGAAYTGTTGEFKFAVVNATGDSTYWSNDTTSTTGDEPVDAVTLPVSNGLFNVLLGDTALMAELPASAFDGAERYLRVWFSSDGSSFTLLSPDRRIAAVPYALQAEEARNAWRTTGNAGTDPAFDFLGTTDNQALEVRVNSSRILRLEPNVASPNLIGGYSDNWVADGVFGATIDGGGGSASPNRVTDHYGVVGGGANNQAGSDDGQVGGNTYSTVSGGQGNTASGTIATVGGGKGNTASGDRSTVAGGDANMAAGPYSMIPGGVYNEARGKTAFAAGRRAKATLDGCFVWGDDTDADVTCTAANQFVARATGGVSFDTGGNGFLIDDNAAWHAGNDGAASGLDADLLDGQHASAFQQHYANVVIVAKSGGDYDTITAALDSIGDAGDTNRYLVRVMPGVYTERVTMKSYVDIEGSGELTTRITYGGSANPTTGTVVGANEAELRFLTVANTGGDTYATAIYNHLASPRLIHVTLTASGGTASNSGVGNDNSSPVMTNVTASASGGSYSYGVYNSTNSSPVMTNVTASASGGSYSYGVYNSTNSTPTMTGGSASASGGSVRNVGVYGSDSSWTMTGGTVSASGGAESDGVRNQNSSPTIQNCTIRASGATHNYGIYNLGASGSYTVRINNSQITGSTNTIYNDFRFTTLVGATLLDGGSVYVNSGTVTCAGVYDEAYNLYTNSCP